MNKGLWAGTSDLLVETSDQPRDRLPLFGREGADSRRSISIAPASLPMMGGMRDRLSPARGALLNAAGIEAERRRRTRLRSRKPGLRRADDLRATTRAKSAPHPSVAKRKLCVPSKTAQQSRIFEIRDHHLSADRTSWLNFIVMVHYIYMTNSKFSEVITRAKRWPETRQIEAANLLETFEAQTKCPLQLNDEQVAEIERRLSLSAPRLFTIETARRRVLG